MLKIGLVGLGFMGRTHFRSYLRLQEAGVPIQLTAICDGDDNKFNGKFAEGNLEVDHSGADWSQYNLYSDLETMLAEEELDVVDITLPTFLHAETVIKALNKGHHVLCEKPMAMTSEEGQAMIEAARRSGKTLMIAQCLRFWPAYEYLKDTVASGRYGAVLSASFFRGGNPPIWTHNNWMVRKEASGGGLLDLHIHDVDLINWLFGPPDAVSTIARDVLPESVYDIVSTNYIYPDQKVVNAQMDRTLCGDFGFKMMYRVNFEGGNLVFENGVLTDNPQAEKGFVPNLPNETGYYREIDYFIQSILENRPVERALPEDTLRTLFIAEAERDSAERNGAIIALAK
ncbi:Gfo/Idh/MocA family protein [Paenibacillus sp. GCM10027626]|uniref:Gfo/Idh/MocA family protein n=1 Tax=Paenibacillus sp. GCM10027626 TaxID=3273411 RepID=UPI0036432F90